jgi:hypothetical protein
LIITKLYKGEKIMRKILAAVLLVALVATSSFGASLAATGTGAFADAGKSIYPNVLGTPGTASGTAVGKLSTGVYIAWNCLTTSYAIETQHNSGVRAFGTASDSTAITWKTVTKGADLANPASAGVAAVLALGWSVM